MAEFAFLHFSIETLVINFYKKMDCHEKLFHNYQSIVGDCRNRNLVIQVSVYLKFIKCLILLL